MATSVRRFEYSVGISVGSTMLLFAMVFGRLSAEEENGFDNPILFACHFYSFY